MPIQTDLSVSPYFDDYSEDSNYYKVLFKPSVAVQVRELNQLQSMLQGQVEKFGDAIFKRGTVIDGCNFTFFDTLKYARIKDNEVDGTPVNVAAYKDLYVKDSDGLIGYVIDTAAGFESQSPDLNTLFIRYINSGSNYAKNQFDKNNILTVYDANFPITKALVNEGSSGFSNNDTLVIYPAIAVQNSTGGAYFAPNTWVINSKVVQDTTGAEAEILEVNSTANSAALIIKVRPLETDLDDAQFDANNWAIIGGYTITGATLGATSANASANAIVVATVGSDSQGTLITDGTGKIIQVAVSAGGSGYYVPPHVTVASTGGAIEAANIEAYNYQARVTTQNDDAGIGNSYAVGVSQGIIYQKGYFSRVNSQLVVVEKYADSTTPHEKVVGFDTVETLINSNDDQSLLDNALGSFNYTAPGADRVKLTPTLVVLEKGESDANSDFLPLIEFNRGKPFKQVRGTQYSRLGVELAQRTFEESGNYVIDTFRSTTASAEDNEDTSFNVVIDPGIAYILGNRVESVLDYTETLDKGIDTLSLSNTSIDLNYGYYIRVNELGGYFKFNTGDVISLRDTALQYSSNTTLAGTEPAAPGAEIGKARMKVLSYESGEPGSSAKYRLYVWDVQMNAGKNFSAVRGVYYNGTTYKGYADIVTDAGIAKIYDNTKGQLIFPTGYSAVKVANNLTYNYRSVNAVAVANTTGVINVAPIAGSWTYTGELSTAEKSDLIITPLASFETANLATASIGAGSTSNTTVVLSNATFGAALSVGDYIKIYGTSTKIRKVAGITNSTYITVDSGLGLTNATSNVSFILPKYTPIQLSTRSDRSANVNGSYLRIFVNPPAAFTAGGDVAVSYNAKRSAIAPTTKNTDRNTFVKLNLSTHTSGVAGPWYLGVPDIFRLRAVYTSTSATVNTNSTDITNEFFIDHNQKENSYDGGYLFKKPGSTYTLTASDYLLAQFDAYDKTGGVYTVTSYNVDDAANLASLSVTSTDVNTVEIPEMYTSTGRYYDLIDTIDFRISANTEANIVSTATDPNITTNPIESAYASRYNSADEKYFPVPQGDLSFNLEAYTGRLDRIIVNANGDFSTIRGDSGKKAPPPEPQDSLTVNVLSIPPYPSLPKNKSGTMIEILDTKIANIKYTNQREIDYTIVENISDGNISYEQPVAYKMTDIASIDRRLKNIEYRIDLKDIEDNIKDKSIGSSANATMQRFKFGFFVDNFTSTDYSALDDPEYSAMNFNYRITPFKQQKNIKHRFYTANTTTANVVTGNMLTLPYEEVSVIKQLNATAKLDNANTRISQQTAVYEYLTTKEIVNQYNRGKIRKEPDTALTFSGTAGPVSLFISPGGPDRWEIYQSTTPGFTPSASTLTITSEAAVNMTNDEKNRIVSVKGLAGAPKKKLGSIKFSAKSGNPKYWVSGTGKISWTHDPNKGKYYIIIVYKNSGANIWRIEYPVDASVATFTSTGRAAQVKYSGKINALTPRSLNVVGKLHADLGVNGYIRTNENKSGTIAADKTGKVTFSKISKGTKLKVSDETAGPCKISVEIAGLRPLTRHNFYINKVLSNSKAMARNGAFSGGFGTDTATTSSLVTDANGVLKADIYYDNGFPDNITETTYSQLQALIKGVAANKVFVFSSVDNMSVASYTIKTAIKITV
jgi:hypothetical protein